MSAETEKSLMARYWGHDYQETDLPWLEQLAKREHERQADNAKG